MAITAVINQKGGSGKTTTAVNLAAALARTNKSVLLVDLDPQAHATIHLGFTPPEAQSTYDLLLGEGAPPLPVPGNERLSLIPSSIRLSAAELELFSTLGREHILRNRLTPHAGDFDYVVIDCPPALSMLTINALCAATDIIVPVAAEFLALEGMTQLLNTLNLVRSTFGNPLEVRGILLTRFDARQTICREIRDRLRAYELPLFETVIRENVRLKEAPSHGRSIFDYAPSSYGASDYAALAEELL